MGLLDDLRNQAQSKKTADEEEAARKADREKYYQEKILPRMIKAYQFFNEFVEHLNYINLEIIVDYPLLQDGRPQPLRQKGYTVVIDSSKALKRIDFSMEGVLDIPVEYEIFGREAVHKHADRIDRYSFRHTRKDKKDPASMEVVLAKFTLLGPLPLKVTVEADVEQSQIIVTIRNFNEPGFTKYSLTVEQFSDEFLDQIGKFVLRKEDRLFGKSEEISEEAKKKLRDRMIVEARIRQQELIEAEARRQAEEAAEKERSAKEQIKRAVNTKVAKGKESLKDMFSKLKKQANVVTTSVQEQTPAPTQTAQQAPSKPAAPVVQTTQQTTVAKTSTAPAQTIQKDKVPPVPPAQIQAPLPPAVSAAEKQPAHNPVIAEPTSQAAKAVDSNEQKPQAPAPQIVQATPKKVQPPKVYNAPENNPFIKPEPPEDTPVSASDQTETGKEDIPTSESIAAATTSSKSDISPEALERDLARIIERDKPEEQSASAPPATKTSNPFLTPASSPAQTSLSSDGTNTANPFLQTSKTKATTVKSPPPSDETKKPKAILKSGELSTDLSANLTIPRKDKSAGEKPQSVPKDPAQNPFLNPEALDIDIASNVASPRADDDAKEIS